MLDQTVKDNLCKIQMTPSFKNLLHMQDIAVHKGVVSFLSKAVLIKQTVFSR